MAASWSAWLNKMAAVWQIFSNTFSWQKRSVFLFNFRNFYSQGSNELLILALFPVNIAFRWMPLNLIIMHDKSTLVQIMAWCRQQSNYLSQCLPRYILSPYGFTRPQWVNNRSLLWVMVYPNKPLPDTMMTQSEFWWWSLNSAVSVTLWERKYQRSTRESFHHSNF